MKNEEASV